MLLGSERLSRARTELANQRAHKVQSQKASRDQYQQGRCLFISLKD